MFALPRSIGVSKLSHEPRAIFNISPKHGFSPKLRLITEQSAPLAFYTTTNFWVVAGAIYAFYFFLQLFGADLVPFLSVSQVTEWLPKLKSEYRALESARDSATAASYVRAYAGCAIILLTVLVSYCLTVVPLVLTSKTPVRELPDGPRSFGILVFLTILLVLMFLIPWPFGAGTRLPTDSGAIAAIAFVFWSLFFIATHAIVYVCQVLRYWADR